MNCGWNRETARNFNRTAGCQQGETYRGPRPFGKTGAIRPPRAIWPPRSAFGRDAGFERAPDGGNPVCCVRNGSAALPRPEAVPAVDTG